MILQLFFNRKVLGAFVAVMQLDFFMTTLLMFLQCTFPRKLTMADAAFDIFVFAEEMSLHRNFQRKAHAAFGAVVWLELSVGCSRVHVQTGLTQEVFQTNVAFEEA